MVTGFPFHRRLIVLINHRLVFMYIYAYNDLILTSTARASLTLPRLSAMHPPIGSNARAHKALLRIRIEPQLDVSERLEVLRNAGRYGISYYDSSYLTSAIRLEATLVTEDMILRRAARECGVPTSSAGEIARA